MEDAMEGVKVGKALAQQADGLKKRSEYEAAAAETTVASSHCGRSRTLPVDLADRGPLAGLKCPLGGLKSPFGGLKVGTVHGEHVTVGFGELRVADVSNQTLAAQMELVSAVTPES